MSLKGVDDDNREFATDEEIEAARGLHQTDECEIDTPAKISIGDDGFWVQAWVFVPWDSE